MNSVARRQTGFALMIVMLLVAVSAVLGLSYLAASSVRLCGADNLVSASRGTYLAESGLEHALWALEADPDAVLPSQPVNAGPFYADGTNDSYSFSMVEQAGKPYYYTVTSTGSVGGLARSASMAVRLTCRYPELVMSCNPYRYWRLSDSEYRAYDEVTGSYGIYKDGANSGVDGVMIPDTAADFDGINDRVDLGPVDIGGSACTIAAWFKAEGWPRGKGAVVCKSKGDSPGDTWWMIGVDGNDADKRLRFTLKAGGSTQDFRTDSGIISLGEWVFAVGVYDGATMKLYKDGVLVGSKSQSGTVNVDSRYPAWIGAAPYDVSKMPWNGVIDEVAIFKHALTAEQIQALYEARAAVAEMISWQ